MSNLLIEYRSNKTAHEDEYDGSERASWEFIGECGAYLLLEEYERTSIADNKSHVVWMKVGVAFLRHTFGEPPVGCT